LPACPQEIRMFLRIHKTIIEIFSPRSPATIFTVSLTLLILLGWLDHVTGGYSLIVFYLIPVSLMAWFVTRTSGVLFCLLALTARFIADMAPGSFALNTTELHYWNLFIEFLFLLIMSLLFSVLRRNLDSEKTKASTDPLTGAFNRRSFFGLADYEIKRSRRYGQPFTLAYIDLDNFKEVNDRRGHHVGDELLIAVVTTMLGNIRDTDILARLGGDEFVLLLPETHSEAALTFLAKIHDRLQQTMTSNNWPVSFSIGAVTYLKTPASVDGAICRADMLMYEVKRSGKNRLLHIEATEADNG
jgi:diguanylate cyclase (GGDEF)-like protein